MVMFTPFRIWLPSSEEACKSVISNKAGLGCDTFISLLRAFNYYYQHRVNYVTLFLSDIFQALKFS